MQYQNNHFDSKSINYSNFNMQSQNNNKKNMYGYNVPMNIIENSNQRSRSSFNYSNQRLPHNQSNQINNKPKIYRGNSQNINAQKRITNPHIISPNYTSNNNFSPNNVII